MYKYVTGLLPNIFNNFFHKKEDYHLHRTRNATSLRPPRNTTQHATRFIRTTGVALWNTLELSISVNQKIGTFKSHLKKFILNARVP
jgi:hypothetical protein